MQMAAKRLFVAGPEFSQHQKVRADVLYVLDNRRDPGPATVADVPVENAHFLTPKMSSCRDRTRCCQAASRLIGG